MEKQNEWVRIAMRVYMINKFRLYGFCWFVGVDSEPLDKFKASDLKGASWCRKAPLLDDLGCFGAALDFDGPIQILFARVKKSSQGIPGWGGHRDPVPGYVFDVDLV